MDLGAVFVDPVVEEHSVTFGSLEAEGLLGPGGTPYSAMFVMPRFLWESYGSPDRVLVRLGLPSESEADVPSTNAWLEPLYEGG